MARRGYSETAALTYLAADVTAGATSFTAQDASTWAGIATNGPFIVTLDRGRASEERLLCTTINTTTGVISGATRGYHGTTGVAHTAAVCTVEHTSAAIDFDEANGHINDTTLDHHTQYARVDGTRTVTGAQLFTGGPTFRKAQADVRTNVSLIVGRAVTTDAQSIEFTIGTAYGAIIGRQQSSDNLTFGFDDGTNYLEKLRLDTNGGLALTGGALATGATTGFLYPRTCAGTPTGTPASIPSGSAPAVYDTTANKLWVYNGSWRSVTLA